MNTIQAPTSIVSLSQDQSVPIWFTTDFTRAIGIETEFMDRAHLFAAQNLDLLIQPTIKILTKTNM